MICTGVSCSLSYVFRYRYIQTFKINVDASLDAFIYCRDFLRLLSILVGADDKLKKGAISNVRLYRRDNGLLPFHATVGVTWRRTLGSEPEDRRIPFMYILFWFILEDVIQYFNHIQNNIFHTGADFNVPTQN
jgi:hypothetical protein